MIKLLSSGAGTIEYFDGNEFTYAAAPAGATHTVTHNKGKRPYFSICYFKTSGVWRQMQDLYWVSPASYSWHVIDASTINAEIYALWNNPTNSPTPAKFRLLFLPINAVWP